MIGSAPILTTRGGAIAPPYFNLVDFGHFEIFNCLKFEAERKDFMKTIEELKQEFLNHLAEMDKSQMTLYELSCYVDLLRKADDLFKPGYTEVMSGLAARLGNLAGGVGNG